MKRLAIGVMLLVALTACGPDKPKPEDTRDPLQKCLEDNHGLGCATAGQFCTRTNAKATSKSGRDLVCTKRGSKLRWRYV